MAHPGISSIAAVAVLASLVWRVAARPERRAATAPGPAAEPRWRVEPAVLWTFVVALLFANQLVVAVYVDARGGPGFVQQYLGDFWFHVLQGPGVHRVAVWLGPRAEWLAPSVLNVQAFLELPFTLLAYLTVARLLGRAALAPLVRLPVLMLTGLFCTATFVAVERWFSSPWTDADIWLRWASALATPPALAWLLAGHRRAPATPEPLNLSRLLSFLLGALGLGVLVLFVYDTCLLYNLRHARFLWPYALFALALCVAALCLARSSTAQPVSPMLSLLHTVFVQFTWLFFVPALSLRYMGTSPGVLGGYGVLLLATFVFVAFKVQAWPRAGFTVVLALSAAFASAGIAAAMVAMVPRPYASVFELKLLLGTLVTLGGTALVGRALEVLAQRALPTAPG